MNMEDVQRRLWEQSLNHRESRQLSGTLFEEDHRKYRIRKLYDLMHNPNWLRMACQRVLARSRGKASGVDNQTVSDFESAYETNLETLRLELKRKTYQPRPVRRVMIDKGNGKQRPLGIPCLRDKIVQEAMRMLLEPIFEAEFHDNSYGFRPHRNAQQAVFRCQQLIHRKFSWVIEGDVKACFDEISHKAILRNLREKIMDNRFLELTNRILKAGIHEKGSLYPSTKGVPQGGVLSPLLANAVLNKLDWFLHGKGVYDKRKERIWKYGLPNVRFVRYADDWCVFMTRQTKMHAETLREQIREFLKQECNLELSPEKTHVTHVRDGFDFLGFRLNCSTGRAGKTVPKIKIGDKALKAVRQRLDNALRYRPQQESISLRVARAGMVIRGWAQYFRIACDVYRRSSYLDNYALWAAVKAACRKFDISTGQCFKRYYRRGYFVVSRDCRLDKFREVSLKHDYRRPMQYKPGEGIYREDDLLEAPKFLTERLRPGAADTRVYVIQRDNYTCCNCGGRVSASRAHVDHIKPVKRHASFLQAHVLGNLQTLCISCHKKKTAAERMT